LEGFRSLQKLTISIGQLKTLQEFDPRIWFGRVSKLAKIDYIYWPIESTLRIWFGRVSKLANIAYIYWLTKCTPKAWFEWVF
jgi:hypothetical protein